MSEQGFGVQEFFFREPTPDIKRCYLPYFLYSLQYTISTLKNWSRIRAKMLAPAPAQYPGSGRLQLRNTVSELRATYCALNTEPTEKALVRHIVDKRHFSSR